MMGKKVIPGHTSPSDNNKIVLSDANIDVFCWRDDAQRISLTPRQRWQ